MSDVYCPKGKRNRKEIVCTISGQLCGNVFFANRQGNGKTQMLPSNAHF